MKICWELCWSPYVILYSEKKNVNILIVNNQNGWPMFRQVLERGSCFFCCCFFFVWLHKVWHALQSHADQLVFVNNTDYTILSLKFAQWHKAVPILRPGVSLHNTYSWFSYIYVKYWCQKWDFGCQNWDSWTVNLPMRTVYLRKGRLSSRLRWWGWSQGHLPTEMIRNNLLVV